jgi:hypothetical protein
MIAGAFFDTRPVDSSGSLAESPAGAVQRGADYDEVLARVWRDLSARIAHATATLPKEGERIAAERALDGVAHLGWPMIVSMSHSPHAAVWRALGHADRPPIAFREADRLRVDFARLTPSQRRRLEEPRSSSP